MSMLAWMRCMLISYCHELQYLFRLLPSLWVLYLTNYLCGMTCCSRLTTGNRATEIELLRERDIYYILNANHMANGASSI